MVDGLVSNFGLIAGVAAATNSAKPVVIAGVAGLLAGAFSMGSGEYISVRSQNESMQAEVEVERRELERNPEAELAELTQIYIDRGVDPELARLVAEQLSADPSRRWRSTPRRSSASTSTTCPTRGWRPARRSCRSRSARCCRCCRSCSARDVLRLAAVLALVGLFVTGAITVPVHHPHLVLRRRPAAAARRADLRGHLRHRAPDRRHVS